MFWYFLHYCFLVDLIIHQVYNVLAFSLHCSSCNKSLFSLHIPNIVVSEPSLKPPFLPLVLVFQAMNFIGPNNSQMPIPTLTKEVTFEHWCVKIKTLLRLQDVWDWWRRMLSKWMMRHSRKKITPKLNGKTCLKLKSSCYIKNVPMFSFNSTVLLL